METYEIWEGYGLPDKKVGVITLNGDVVQLNIPDKRTRAFYEEFGLGAKGYTPNDGKEYIKALCAKFSMSSTIFIKKISEQGEDMCTSDKGDNLYRKSDFKLGCFHGKRDAENPDSEAHIQRIVYQSMRVKLACTKEVTTDIRVIGYEIPLTATSKRCKCIDLLGYDKEHNLYLIELKKGVSTEPTQKVLEQILDYKNIFESILPHIEEEFLNTFYFKLVTKKVIPILLAPNEFYKKRASELPRDSEILFYYFRNREIKSHDIINPVFIHRYKGIK